MSSSYFSDIPHLTFVEVLERKDDALLRSVAERFSGESLPPDKPRKEVIQLIADLILSGKKLPLLIREIVNLPFSTYLFMIFDVHGGEGKLRLHAEYCREVLRDVQDLFFLHRTEKEGEEDWLFFYLPDDLHKLLIKHKKEIRNARIWIDNLLHMAISATRLYGVLTLTEFRDIIHRYGFQEYLDLSVEDIRKIITTQRVSGDFEYFDPYLVYGEIIPIDKSKIFDCKNFLTERQGDRWYPQTPQDFMEFDHTFPFFRSADFKPMEVFFRRHGVRARGSQDDLFLLIHRLVNQGRDLVDIAEIIARDCTKIDSKSFNELADLIQDLHDGARWCKYNGHTLKEIIHQKGLKTFQEKGGGE